MIDVNSNDQNSKESKRGSHSVFKIQVYWNTYCHYSKIKSSHQSTEEPDEIVPKWVGKSISEFLSATLVLF